MLIRISARLGNLLPAIYREEPTEVIIFNRLLFVVDNIYRKVIGGHPIPVNNSVIYRMRKYCIEMIYYLTSLKFLTQRFIREITAITFPLLNDFEGRIIGMLSHGPAPNKSSGRFQKIIAGTAIFSTAGCNRTQNDGETYLCRSIQPEGLSLIKLLHNSSKSQCSLCNRAQILNFKRAYFE